MVVHQAPTEIVEEDKYWLYAMEALEGHKPAADAHRTRDRYFRCHGVTRPQELTAEDLPAATADAVRELDREALEHEMTGGKWHVPGSEKLIDRLWTDIVADVDNQVLWGAKAMTETGWRAHPGEQYMLLVYTPNYFDKSDVDRVREHLRKQYAVTDELFYKPDLYSAKGIQPDTAENWGLSMAARYRA